ncbi:MAG: dienelactone hydrolase family protein [Pseudomonadota bacterium]
MSLLPCVEVNPAEEADSAVIWLHGLGANGHDFEPIVPELRLPESMNVRFVFPHAPSIPVTINNGYVMPAWYDITDMSIDRKIDTAQIEASAASIRNLVQREIDNGIPANRIVIAGFSQGGAVAYEVALSFSESLAGLMALSTYFATEPTILLHPANAAIPIHISHGTLDPIVPALLGQKAFERLLAKGYRPEYKTYAMEHSIHPNQIVDIGEFLKSALG